MDNIIKAAFIAAAFGIVAGMSAHGFYAAHRGFTSEAGQAEADRAAMTRPYQAGGQHWHWTHRDPWDKNPLSHDNSTALFKLWSH